MHSGPFLQNLLAHICRSHSLDLWPAKRQWGRTSIVRPHCHSSVALSGKSCPGTCCLAVRELFAATAWTAMPCAFRLPGSANEPFLLVAHRGAAPGEKTEHAMQ